MIENFLLVSKEPMPTRLQSKLLLCNASRGVDKAYRTRNTFHIRVPPDLKSAYEVHETEGRCQSTDDFKRA
jgi:hypothetical protein